MRLNRQTLVASLTAAFLTLGLLSPLPTSAQVIVHDPVNYATMVNNLAKTTIITQQQIQQIQAAMNQIQLAEQTYNQMQSMTNPNIALANKWALLQPYLKQLADKINTGNQIATQAANLQTTFQASFPQYQPDQPYTDLYAQWRAGTMDSVANALRAAQASNNSLASESISLNQLFNARPESQVEAINTGNMLAASMITQMRELRQMMAAQIGSQSAYYTAQVNSNQAARRDPSNLLLLHVFGDVPNALNNGSVTLK